MVYRSYAREIQSFTLSDQTTWLETKTDYFWQLHEQLSGSIAPNNRDDLMHELLMEPGFKRIKEEAQTVHADGARFIWREFYLSFLSKKGLGNIAFLMVQIITILIIMFHNLYSLEHRTRMDLFIRTTKLGDERLNSLKRTIVLKASIGITLIILVGRLFVLYRAYQPELFGVSVRSLGSIGLSGGISSLPIILVPLTFSLIVLVFSTAMALVANKLFQSQSDPANSFLLGFSLYLIPLGLWLLSL